MRVAVYGTLKQGFGNHRLLIGSELVGKAVVGGFDMYSVGAFPCIKEGQGAICVEVYEVDDLTLHNLDRLEGYRSNDEPRSMYIRKEIEVLGEQAYIYVWNGSVEGMAPARQRVFEW